MCDPLTAPEDFTAPTEGLVAHVPLNEGEGNEVASICGPQTKFKATGEKEPGEPP